MYSLNRNTKYLIRNTSESGATLIEVLIYILLLSFIMSAMLISVNQILSYSYSASSKSSVEQEAAFILAKINWTLNDANSVSVPTSNTLIVTKDSGSVTITSVGDSIVIGTTPPLPLNASRIKVSNLNFQKIQTGSAVSVKSSFGIDGKYFESYRTIR